jgi:hypothetical protein
MIDNFDNLMIESAYCKVYENWQQTQQMRGARELQERQSRAVSNFLQFAEKFYKSVENNEAVKQSDLFKKLDTVMEYLQINIQRGQVPNFSYDNQLKHLTQQLYMSTGNINALDPSITSNPILKSLFAQLQSSVNGLIQLSRF